MPHGIPGASPLTTVKRTSERVYDAQRFQGRTLTSTWGKSRGWLKGVNFQPRLIHVLAPLTSFRRCSNDLQPPRPCFFVNRLYPFLWISLLPSPFFFLSFVFLLRSRNILFSGVCKVFLNSFNLFLLIIVPLLELVQNHFIFYRKWMERSISSFCLLI